ncbi:sulfotransferase family protein [Shimia isoporae]|uniref:Sulfotransferase family protein n=1 Tax=Shimia isoporae TaxID=647720 RepID=A0A4R1N169_9RHOB|nr:sulfotransferase family 2 domain-containing protein [Shimia isoporae]TCK99849.1 sulfotransferase family protein [Shimia isoporae]
MPKTRTIVLHYHLFKNAGTSLDRIFKKNFGDKWVTHEFPTKGGNNTPLVTQWILGNPNAVVFSTHTAVGPIPKIAGVNIITVMMLRDPISRIRSAYRFERNQKSDSWGANLAKETDLAGYVDARLARKGDRQCRNFQSDRLATMFPAKVPELQRAMEGFNSLSVVGLVEDFDGTLKRLREAMVPHFPDFEAENVKANTTDAKPEQEEDPVLLRRLIEANVYDRAIWETAMDKFGGR